MTKALFIDAQREGYSPAQVSHTMTVAELISFLEQFEDDTPIYLSHDRGYTYGGIDEFSISEEDYDEEDY